MQTVKVGNVTYVPLKAIPKKHHAAFRPIIKKNPLVAINVDGKLYKPVDQKNVKPVDKNGVTYLPVKEVKNPKKITNPIKSESTGPVQTFKVGNITYIPSTVVPKTYAPIF